MSDTKTLATIVIFVVCALYVLALLVIGIKFVIQYIRFLRGIDGSGDIHWRQSTGETPRNSFLHELQINTVRGNRGRRPIEPPPSYAYAMDEAPPSYDQVNHCEKNSFSTTTTTKDSNLPSSNTSCLKSSPESLKQEGVVVDCSIPISISINMDNSDNSNSNVMISINSINNSSSSSNNNNGETSVHI